MPEKAVMFANPANSVGNTFNTEDGLDWEGLRARWIAHASEEEIEASAERAQRIIDGYRKNKAWKEKT